MSTPNSSKDSFLRQMVPRQTPAQMFESNKELYIQFLVTLYVTFTAISGVGTAPACLLACLNAGIPACTSNFINACMHACLTASVQKICFDK